MFDDEDLRGQLRTFMEREIAGSRPGVVDDVEARTRVRHRRHRVALGAVAAALLVIVAATIVVVARRPATFDASAPPDPRVGVVVLPGSGAQWVAFAVQNNLDHVVGYDTVGLVDRRRGSTWSQVGYFAGLGIGGERPATLHPNRPTATLSIELTAEPHALGPVRWIDVSSLSPGTYRVRIPVAWPLAAGTDSVVDRVEHATAVSAFEIRSGEPPQSPPPAGSARLEPGLRVVSGAPMSLALSLVGGTSDLGADTKIEQSTALTVHVRRWANARWRDVATLPARRLHDIRTVIALPQLARGLYELARARATGSEITGWLFVTNDAVTSPPSPLRCHVTLGTDSSDTVVESAPGVAASGKVGAYAVRFTIQRISADGGGFMRVDFTGPTLGANTHAAGGFSTQTDDFSGRIATPDGMLAYSCGA
jgi:hypothetical protein